MRAWMSGPRGQALRSRLREWNWRVQRRLRRTLDVSTLQGRFTVHTWDDYISKALYLSGQFELGMLTDALSFLRSRGLCPPRGSGTIVDVGANIGVIAIAALHTGEMARAIAIEPDPRNFALLERNVGHNDLHERMACLRVAVSDRPGEVPFEFCDWNPGDHRVRVSGPTGAADAAAAGDRYGESRRPVTAVPALPLDDLIAAQDPRFTAEITLIWIDVQGHEGHAFRGAERTLARGVPVMSELWPYGLRRAGFEAADFRSIARRHWRSFWVRRPEGYVAAPIDTIESLFEELGWEGNFTNVLFTAGV